MSEPSLADKVVELDRALRADAIPHAFGGALALAYYFEPRATIDVDLNIFLPPTAHGRVVAALDALGVAAKASTETVEETGQVRLLWGRSPVDLFYAYDKLHRAMRRQAREVPFGHEPISILGPEHLIVCKAMFNRAKDWLDIEGMLKTTSGIDQHQVMRDLERVVGGADPRLIRLSGLLSSN